MAIRKITTVLILLFTLTAHAQNYSSIISDDEISDFLNNIVNDSVPINTKILQWHKANFKDSLSYYDLDDILDEHLYSKSGCADTMFIQSDRAFLYKQFISIQDSVWHKSIVRTGVTRNKRKVNGYYYSIPLFSSDKRFAVIRKVHLGKFSSGGIYIYRKSYNNVWQQYCCIIKWIT